MPINITEDSLLEYHGALPAFLYVFNYTKQGTTTDVTVQSYVEVERVREELGNERFEAFFNKHNSKNKKQQ